MRHYLLPCLLIFALPPACQLQNPASETPVESSAGLPEMRTIPTDESTAEIIPSNLQRLIADLLFSGLQALDDDRLLTPRFDNAYDYFNEVLKLQPDNEIALDGMQDIVERYLALALEAGNRGNFRNADQLLGRAVMIDSAHPGIAPVREALDAERNSGDLFFPLEERALRRQDAAIRETLAEVAAQAREHDAFVLITAPDDELARWMYSVMRESVSGYRLRGNIEISGSALIRLRMPVDNTIEVN